MYKCRKCGEELQEGINQYPSDYKNHDHICKECKRKHIKKRMEEDPSLYERQKAANRKWAYKKYHSLSDQEKQDMLESRRDYKRNYYRKRKEKEKLDSKERLDHIMQSFNESWEDDGESKDN